MPARRKHFRAWVVDHVPIALLTHAHEAGIAVVLIIVSGPLLGGNATPETIYSQVPPWMSAFWAWGLMAGGVLTIYGLIAFRPRAEWAGQLILGYALTFYALALIVGGGAKAFVASAVFGVLGLVSWWRSFKITSQAYVQHRLVLEAKAAHEQVELERLIREDRERDRRRREDRR